MEGGKGAQEGRGGLWLGIPKVGPLPRLGSPAAGLIRCGPIGTGGACPARSEVPCWDVPVLSRAGLPKQWRCWCPLLQCWPAALSSGRCALLGAWSLAEQQHPHLRFPLRTQFRSQAASFGWKRTRPAIYLTAVTPLHASPLLSSSPARPAPFSIACFRSTPDRQDRPQHQFPISSRPRHYSVPLPGPLAILAASAPSRWTGTRLDRFAQNIVTP